MSFRRCDWGLGCYGRKAWVSRRTAPSGPAGRAPKPCQRVLPLAAELHVHRDRSSYKAPIRRACQTKVSAPTRADGVLSDSACFPSHLSRWVFAAPAVRRLPVGDETARSERGPSPRFGDAFSDPITSTATELQPPDRPTNDQEAAVLGRPPPPRRPRAKFANATRETGCGKSCLYGQLSLPSAKLTHGCWKLSP